MTFIRTLFTISIILTAFMSYGQVVSDHKLEQIGLTNKEVSERALRLLTQDFYWSPIEESSPFGSDDGSDVFYYFREWRNANENEDPVIFLNQLINEWGYPRFDLNELSEKKIEKYLETKGGNIDSQIPMLREQFKKMSKDAGKEFNEDEFQQIISMTSDGMGWTYLLSQDNAVIAVGFGQFVLEGRIDKGIKDLTKTALERELLPILINKWDEDYRKERTAILNQMLSDLNKM